MSKTEIKVLWKIMFAAGLIMILFRMEISRYVSDLAALLTAGIALAGLSGVGLLLEMYGKRSQIALHDE